MARKICNGAGPYFLSLVEVKSNRCSHLCLTLLSLVKNSSQWVQVVSFDFVEVSDVARQLLTLANHPEARGIYNVGSGVPRSVLELAEDAIRAHGGTITLKRGVYKDRPDEPLAFWAWLKKLQNLQCNPQTHS